MQSSTVWLFVYGSLKRAQANHHELGQAEYVSSARTAPRCALRIIDGYPALVPGSCAVLGELYRMPASALPALDEFEGPGYVRREIELVGGRRAFSFVSRVPAS